MPKAVITGVRGSGFRRSVFDLEALSSPRKATRPQQPDCAAPFKSGETGSAIACAVLATTD